MKRAVLAILLALLALAAWWLGRPEPVPDASSPAPPPVIADLAPERAVVVEAPVTLVRGTGFDRSYRSAGASAAEDLAQVAELLDAVGLMVKDLDRFPLPDNAAFTAFLQGKNPHRMAWIRPGHPAVSPQGELLDRWESPLFFHRESSRRTELRSAGPDRTLWTDDDVIRPVP